MSSKVIIHWLRPHPAYAYFFGDECELDAKAAQALKDGGFVTVRPIEKKPTSKSK